MPTLSEELSILFGVCSEGPRSKKEANCFHKCRSSDGRGDFSCYSGEVDLIERLKTLLESASAGLRDSSVQMADDRIFMRLNRPNVFRHGLSQAMSSSDYGRNRLFEGNKVSTTVDVTAPPDSPSRWRMAKTEEILRKAVLLSGGTLAPEPSFHLVVTNKTRRPLDNGAVILVGNVACRSAIDDVLRAFSEQISQMSQVRLGDDTPDDNLDSLTTASVTFALLNGNLSKTVSIGLDSSVIPFCKGAVFVLYNYCRMTHVVFKYKKLEASGSYPPLPDLDRVDFSLLATPEEWDLMLNFVVDWPQVFESSVSGLKSGDFKLHKVLDFLKSLASKFSAYYRRTRILTESRPHLVPVLHARIYLVLGLMEVYRNALDLLGLEPVRNM